MTQGVERIPDSLGYLVINEDGGVISVSELVQSQLHSDNQSYPSLELIKRSLIGKKSSGPSLIKHGEA